MLKLDIGDHNYEERNSITYSCQYHVVFCTKYRRNLLDERVQAKLSELLYEYESKLDYKILYVDMKLDTVHLVIQANADVGISRLVGSIKKNTVAPLVNEFPHIKSGMPNLWTRFSFIATCGAVSLDRINEFKRDQIGA